MNNGQTTKRKTIQATYFFLTIPQVPEDLNKEKVEELLTKEESDLKRYAISEEIHTKDVNKGRHLHVWMRFRKQKEFGLNHFDYVGKHGKLEKVRSSKNVCIYISKEDKNPVSNFDLQGYNLKNDFEGGVLSLYRQGWSFQKIMFTYIDVCSKRRWSHMKKTLIEYEDICKQEHMRCNLNGFRYIGRELIEKRLTLKELELFDSFEGYQTLVDILNKISQKSYKQQHKKCCVALLGKPGIGKTFLMRKLSEYVPMYNYPEDGWHRDYYNNLYSAIFWNEWKYDIHDREDYLRLFEGDPVDLKVKGSKANKTDRPFIVLASNESLSFKLDKRFKRDPELKEIHRESLAHRIVEINFGERDLTFITKLLVRYSEDI